MGSILREAEAMQLAAFDFAAEPIDYRRNGDLLTQQIPAKIGKTLFRYTDHYGVTVREEQRDFIVRTSDLGIEPQPGDEILFNGDCFIVGAPNGEPCWSWHSRSSNAQKRIHAKYAGAAESSSSSSEE